MLTSMSRYRFYDNSRSFFHANAGFVPDVWIELDYSSRWSLMAGALKKLRSVNRDFTTHALVMMGSHFHFLFSDSEETGCDSFEGLHNKLKDELKVSNRDDVLARPFHRQKIDSYQQLLHALRYIYRNPVEAGICSKVEDYPFSTVSELIGKQPNLVISSDILHLVQDPFRVLHWLNHEESHRLYGYSRV